MTAMPENVIALRAARRTIVIKTEDGEQEKDARDYAAEKLGLPDLRRVIKRGSAPALYDVELTDGTLVPIGPIAAVADPRRVAEAIADTIGRFPRPMSRAKFNDVANSLLAIAEQVDTGTNAADQLRAWLAAFLGRAGFARPVDLENPEQRADVVNGRARVFVTTEAAVYVQLEDLGEYIRRVQRQRVTQADLAAMLQREGFERTRVQAPRQRAGETAPRVRYWASPQGYTLDTDTDGPTGPSPSTREQNRISPGSGGSGGSGGPGAHVLGADHPSGEPSDGQRALGPLGPSGEETAGSPGSPGSCPVQTPGSPGSPGSVSPAGPTAPTTSRDA